MKFKISFFILLIMCFYDISAQAITLNSVKVNHAINSTRIIFETSQSPNAQAFTLNNPPRLVLDFKSTHYQGNLNALTLYDTAIQSVRRGQPIPGTLRLVFDLKNPIKYKFSTQNNTAILEIFTMPQTMSLKPSVPIVKAATTNKGPIIVVIDPGHGGKDPGALGPHGTSEKKVVLEIAKKLAKLINEQPNMRAVLTRHGDYFVPLRGRMMMARKGKADIFISIHADSYLIKSSGVSVYALSRRGATSEAARWLAQRENYSELGGVDLGELDDQSHLLRSVLIDLAQTATTTDSLRLGEALLNSLDDITTLHYTKVEQAPFVVLKSPDIPSVLVETGFISNSAEEKKLADYRYQDKIAAALYEGIKSYIKKFASRG